MIKIISDPYRYQESTQYDVCATSVEDYVSVRQAIRRALDAQRRLTVYVTHRTVLAWLDDLRGYGPQNILWEDIDPTKTFTDFFGFVPPVLFDAKTVLALNLESLPRPQNGVLVDPIAWILGARLGAVWGEATASPQHLVLLINTIMSQPAPSPVLIPLLNQRLAAWTQDRSQYSGLRSTTLHSDASRYMVRWATQHYDQTLWNDPLFVDIPILTYTPDLVLCRAVLAECSSTMSTYWNRWFAQHQLKAETIVQSLNQMSGLSEAELSIMIRMLDLQPTLLDTDLLAVLRQKFAHLPEAVPVIEEWATRVRPGVPLTPDVTWTTERWLHWATDEYIPYFAWVIRMNQPREQQQQLAGQWSDWLYTQYPTWLNNSNSPVLLGQYAQMRDIVETYSDAVVLWLVIDGLTWWQGEFLRQEFISQGLHLGVQQTGIAVLPSMTRISKRALVTGVSAPGHQPQQSIAHAAELQLNHSGIKHHVTYRPDDALKHLYNDETTRCYIVLSNRLDDLAHQMPNFTDDAGIRGSLSDIAKFAVKMSKRASAQGRMLHILVGSDHGSTRLSDSSIALPLPQSTHEFTDWDDIPEQTATSRSTRAAIITDPNRLTEHERQQWYVLDRHRFQLNEHYIVPRGYQYIGRRPVGWTHGGLTPEEVVVPLFYFTPQQLSYENIDVRIIGELEAFRESTLTVAISNPNQIPLQWVIFRLYDGSVYTVERIGTITTHELEIHLPANTTQAKEQTIDWTLTYAINGVNYEIAGQQALFIRRLQIQDSTFDDFFE
jgi:hypothetical protein